MSPEATTFVLEAVNFLILAGLLGYFFFKPVREALANKRAAAEQQASEAKTMLAEAERLRAEAEAQKAKLERELRERREQAREQMDQESDAILSRAREAARKEREAAKRALSGLNDTELARLAEAVADAAGKSVATLLSKLDTPDLDHQLVRAGCRELSSNGSEPLENVVVETASPLEGESRREVEAALGQSAGSAEFRLVPGMGAGIRITSNRGVVDASIHGLSDYARRSLAQELATKGESS